jgi:hypothetical protein
MIGFFNLDSVQLQSVEQDVLAFSATGDIGFKTPWARSPMSAAFGMERRDLFAGTAG